MREQSFLGQPQNPIEEYRHNFFEKMEKDTRIFSNDEYQKIYVIAKEHYGINSPAFVLPKSRFDRHPYPELIPADIEKFLIAINGDSVSDPDFIKYLKTHEHWEIYINNKKGVNLGKYSNVDFRLPVLEQKRPGHCYATLKEFQAAEKDGKLDEYMQWWRNFYQADIEQIKAMTEEKIKKISKNYNADGGGRKMIIQFIQKNMERKEGIYKKIVDKR